MIFALAPRRVFFPRERRAYIDERERKTGIFHGLKKREKCAVLVVRRRDDKNCAPLSLFRKLHCSHGLRFGMWRYFLKVYGRGWDTAFQKCFPNFRARETSVITTRITANYRYNRRITFLQYINAKR